MLDELPKRESMIQWIINHPKQICLMINNSHEHYPDYPKTKGWNIKYRKHGQFNGKKPTWRKRRKTEKQFKTFQQLLIPKNIL